MLTVRRCSAVGGCLCSVRNVHTNMCVTSCVPGNFVRGGSTNSVEDRENGDLGAVAP